MELESKKKKKKGPDKAAVAAKLDRLKELYIDGIIDKAQLMADREKLLSKLPQEEPKRDLTRARQIVLSGDFRERYNELGREGKRALWRSLVDHVVVDDKGNYQIYFSP